MLRAGDMLLLRRPAARAQRYIAVFFLPRGRRNGRLMSLIFHAARPAEPRRPPCRCLIARCRARRAVKAAEAIESPSLPSIGAVIYVPAAMLRTLAARAYAADQNAAHASHRHASEELLPL